MDRMDLKREVEARDIKWLVHFTPAFNLLGIFEEGRLLSRQIMESKGMEHLDILDYVQFTDDIRYDDKNYINLSIQDCNHFLFGVFRNKTKGFLDVTWCVIRIDPKIIWEQDVRFSVTNAANSHNKNNVGISGGLHKFLDMFSESLEVISSSNRRVLSRSGLSKNLTTDEQAEVLVKDEIHLDKILQVCFENENDLARVKAAFSGYDTSKFVVNKIAFDRTRR